MNRVVLSRDVPLPGPGERVLALRVRGTGAGARLLLVAGVRSEPGGPVAVDRPDSCLSFPFEVAEDLALALLELAGEAVLGALPDLDERGGST